MTPNNAIARRQESYDSKPTSIPGTNRQRVTTRNGVALQRQYIVLPAHTWEALTAICIDRHRSGSQVIENLINLASSSGTQKDKPHETSPSN